ncbi:MAG: fatty acid desaturase [Pseudomonadota bacterium]
MTRHEIERVDHVALIAALSAEDRKRLTEKSDRAGLLHLAGHAGAIGLCTVGIGLRVPGFELLLPLQGVLIVFLFTALHECIHGTAFRTGRLNEMVATICGFLVFLPPLWFRFFHLAHHRHTHDLERDPELETPKPETWTAYLIYVSGIPDWVGRIRTILGNALGLRSDRYVPDKARHRVVREARLFTATYGLVFAAAFAMQRTDIVILWLGPLLLGGPFLRLYLLAEHGRCPHVANMLENTRTTFTTALVRFLAWNMPYHAEHHAYPSVPFYRLPLFHRFTRAHLKRTEDGYARFNADYVRTFKKPAKKAV